MTTSKNKKSQHRQMLIWMGALVVGAAVGMLQVGWIDTIMGIILPVYTIIDMIETAENVWSDSCVAALTDHDVK